MERDRLKKNLMIIIIGSLIIFVSYYLVFFLLNLNYVPLNEESIYTFVVPSNGTYCENGIIYVYIINTAYIHNISAEDIILFTVDGEDNITALLSTFKKPLASGESGLIFQTNCGTEPPLGCGSGDHVVKFGTNRTIADPVVNCS